MAQSLLSSSKFSSQRLVLVSRLCANTVCPFMVVTTSLWTKLLALRCASYQQDVSNLEGLTWPILKLNEILSCDTSNTRNPSKIGPRSIDLVIAAGNKSFFDEGRKRKAFELYWASLYDDSVSMLNELISLGAAKSTMSNKAICNPVVILSCLSTFFPTATTISPLLSYGWRLFDSPIILISPLTIGASWLLMSIV